MYVTGGRIWKCPEAKAWIMSSDNTFLQVTHCRFIWMSCTALSCTVYCSVYVFVMV